VVVATGIASVTTQLVVVREFLAQFQGNEIVIALVLFNWLVLGGVGTRLAHRSKSASAAVLAVCSYALAALSTGQIAAIRLLRPKLFPLGAAVGFYPVVVFSVLTMAPYAILVGYVLPYSLFVIRRQDPSFPGARLYIADNLGDVCGGALFSFLLVYWCTPMQALLVANLALIVTAWPLVSTNWRRGLWGGVSLLALILCLWFETGMLNPDVGRLIHYQESRYGRLTLHQDQEQITLFADGRPAFSTQDRSLAEEMVHYPLSQVQRLENILLISTAAGVMEEIEKYHPRQVDYIELDASMAKLLFEYRLMPAVQGLNMIHSDARQWLRESQTRYDAILMNLPEPRTFQLNRFFTDRFFEIVRTHLHPQGIFSFSVEGYANYMNSAQREKISSLVNTLKRHFRNVELLPGLRLFFLCRQSTIDLRIPERLKAKEIPTLYVGPSFHGNVTPERRAGLAENLNPNAPLNYDGRPYLMRVMFAQWFTKFGGSPATMGILLGAALVIYLIRLQRPEFVLFTTGLMTMGSEIWVIFAFQIFIGYIYLKIGILVTIFLAGLLPGAWLGQRFSVRSRTYLPLSDLAMMLFIAAMLVALSTAGDRLSEWFYYVSGFLISLMCGFQFPLALAQLGDTNAAASRMFAVDLIGAACGALIVSTLLIPLWGLVATACVLIGIKSISFLMMGAQYVSHRPTRISGR
jgi:spermidine synthase